MSIDWSPIITDLIILVVTFLLYNVVKPIATCYIEKYKDNKAYQIVVDAVKAAEQTISTNADKKKWVMSYVQELLAKTGIDIDLTELDAKIETAVYAVKKEN